MYFYIYLHIHTYVCVSLIFKFKIISNCMLNKILTHNLTPKYKYIDSVHHKNNKEKNKIK